ncbi:MAG: hypothetical protein V3T30_04855, partial [Thermodesulfobacteriota bacterium]
EGSRTDCILCAQEEEGKELTKMQIELHDDHHKYLAAAEQAKKAIKDRVDQVEPYRFVPEKEEEDEDIPTIKSIRSNPFDFLINSMSAPWPTAHEIEERKLKDELFIGALESYCEGRFNGTVKRVSKP